MASRGVSKGFFETYDPELSKSGTLTDGQGRAWLAKNTSQ
jgi:hypothetical protein